jgi:hypothetical protein
MATNDYVKLIVENGYTPPKIHLTKENLEKYGNGETFVETGTYLGDTIDMVLESGLYENIHSIELNETLFRDAVSKYENVPSVDLWLGDSVDQLAIIVGNLSGPATFYLDAHASGPLSGGKSGGSPVLDEVSIIAASPFNDHTIFIDDVRLFGSAEWSYVSKDDVISKLMEINPKYNIYYLDGEIRNDVLVASVK